MRCFNSGGRGFVSRERSPAFFCDLRRAALLMVLRKGFVRLRCSGLSSSFATGDDLARGARM
jgi:hypothetical protein